MGAANFDWFTTIKEGGAYVALLLFGALIWMNLERNRLLKKLDDRDIKLEALAERLLTISTELKTFLFNERRAS